MAIPLTISIQSRFPRRQEKCSVKGPRLSSTTVDIAKDEGRVVKALGNGYLFDLEAQQMRYKRIRELDRI